MQRLSVLVVDDSAGSAASEAAAAIETAVPDATASVLTDPDRVVDELITGVVRCLVLPASVDETTGGHLARAVRTLYPDLPIVLAGESGNVTPDDVRTIAAPLADDRIIDAVADALADSPETDAARPPSRLETLVLSMFDGFPVHLYAKDEAGRHALVSRALMDQTDRAGLADVDIEGQPNSKHRAAYRDDMRVIEDEESLLNVEEYTEFTDRYVLTSKVPWYDEDGDVVGLAGITRDVTERKRTEQRLRRQKERLAKVALVAAHELRNELQVASGRLEALEVDAPEIDVIARAHRRLSSITDDVVELAAHEREPIDIQSLWLSAPSREVWQSIATRDAALEFGPDRRIAADDELIRLFFETMFRNALEHGGSDVTVTVGGTEDGFFVADDGPGIGVEPPERVFDPGFSTREDNTGFGLYVAERIAADHGWELSVRQPGDSGAWFDVTGVRRPD